MLALYIAPLSFKIFKESHKQIVRKTKFKRNIKYQEIILYKTKQFRMQQYGQLGSIEIKDEQLED